MPLIRDWLDPFLAAHRARFNPRDWPDADTADYRDFATDWLEAFADLQVSQDEADRASRRLTSKPPEWGRNHLPAVLMTVRTMRLERNAAPVAKPTIVPETPVEKPLSQPPMVQVKTQPLGSWPPPRANRPTGEPKLPDPILQRPPVGPAVSTGEGSKP
jgi:hypothetical protein